MRMGFLCCLAMVAAGCAKAPPETAEALADRLARAGIPHDEVKVMPAPSGRHLTIDERVALISDETYIEVLRIEDNRVFDVAKSASVLLSAIEVAVERELPGKPETYPHKPFVVIVRQEPEPGATAAALEAIFGASGE